MRAAASTTRPARSALSPALLEAYLSAAARISRIAVGTAAAPTQVTYRVAEDTTQNYHVEGLPFGTRGGLAIDHTFPSDGEVHLQGVLREPRQHGQLPPVR